MQPFYTFVGQYGNYLFIRGRDEDGERVQKRIAFEPYYFIKSNKKDTGYTDIFGNAVVRKDFDDINAARDFIKRYEDVEGMDIYGLDRWSYLYIYDNYKDLEYDSSKINIIWIDIEVASDDGFPKPDVAEKPVTAIALRRRDMTVVIGCGDYTVKDKNTYYIKCKNEHEILRKFIEVFKNMDADILTGWNTEFFDIPYLCNRIQRLIGENAHKALSPFNIVKERVVQRASNKEQTFEIFGISCLDYMAIYKKFRLEPRESYRLDHICEVELGQKKIDYSEYGNLHTLYKENYQMFIEYNIRDVDLLVELDKKLGLIDQIFAIAYDAKVNYGDTLASVLIWDVIIHNYLMDRGKVVSMKRTPEYDRTIEGGHVKPPIVGIHDWVMSFDLNSLYPHLIMQYNISPDTHIHSSQSAMHMRGNISVDNLLDEKVDTSFLKDLNACMTPNGQLYRKDFQGFLPALMQTMYDDRKRYKKLMLEAKHEYQKNPSAQLEYDISRYHNLQHAKKIQLNSAYGALANKYFRWFDLENAEAITMAGQLSIRWIEKKLNEYLNKVLNTKGRDFVLAVDTDSVYICFSKMVDTVKPKNPIDFLDKVAQEKVEPFIEKSYHQLAEYVNAYAQKMFMKRENIADKAIWTAKKRYIMNVYDSEGVRYSEPKLKMMGIEAIRSSTPGIFREHIKKTLEILMTGSEDAVQKYIADIRSSLTSMTFEEIAFPRSVNFITWKTTKDGRNYPDSWADKNTIYKKATPIQVKGALLYNHYLNKYNLDKKYETINDGEKIKFVYLKKPNPIHETVISCPGGVLPKELNLDKYIDYDMQFVKGYLDPIDAILNVIGWKSEKRNTIEDFFS